jgi:hypothetical protein
MNTVKLILAELVGLFVDDEFLAIAILVIVAAAAICAFTLHATSAVVGGVLLVGCVAVLAVSTVRGMLKT